MINEVLSAFGIKCSLSKKGCPYDNAVAEATYKIIKTEFAFDRVFKNLEDLNKELRNYADAGYSNVSNLESTVEKGIEVIVPNQKQAAHEPKASNTFDKENFKYDKERNCYICPEGKELKYEYHEKSKKKTYLYYKKQVRLY